MIKNLLVIVYHYPPDPVSNPYPTSSWVKHLPDYGWTPLILTGGGETAISAGSTNIYRAPHDQAFGRLVAGRRKMATSRLSFKLLNFALINFLLYPDDKRGWFASGCRAGLAMAAQHPLSAILSVGTPWTDFWIAGALARKLNIPWIADYRDPWTQRTSAHYRRKWFIHDSISRIVEKRICGTCACCLHASEIWADQLAAHLGKKVFSLPNGYDAEDFSPVAGVKPDSARLSLSYVGTLHFPQRLDPFLEGFGMFVRRSHVSSQECRLNFIGTGEITWVRKKYPHLAGYIRYLPYLSKADAIRHMAESHILLLFLNDDTGWYPTKAFEYLAAGNAILASPDNGGVIHEMLERTAAGTVVKGPEQIALWLGEKMAEFRQGGQLKISSRRLRVEDYERSHMARRLAAILDDICLGSPLAAAGER